MSKKEFLIEISFSGRMTLIVEAEDKEEAEDLIFNEDILEFKNTKSVDVEEVQWDMLKKEPQGFTSTPFIRDMIIEEIE